LRSHAVSKELVVLPSSTLDGFLLPLGLSLSVLCLEQDEPLACTHLRELRGTHHGFLVAYLCHRLPSIGWSLLYQGLGFIASGEAKVGIDSVGA
jgi:hypothetical protein